MTQIIPPGYVSTAIRLSSLLFTDGFALITMGNRLPGDADPGEAASLIADALDISQIQNPLSTAVTIDQVVTFTDEFSGLATMSLTGSNANQMPPVNSAVLIEKRTPVRGRRAQGRNFWPCLVQEAAVDAQGQIEAGVLDTLQDIFDTFHTQLVTDGVGPVILQNEEGQTPPITPPPPVTRFVVDPVFATQRRRMRR